MLYMTIYNPQYRSSLDLAIVKYFTYRTYDHIFTCMVIKYFAVLLRNMDDRLCFILRRIVINSNQQIFLAV